MLHKQHAPHDFSFICCLFFKQLVNSKLECVSVSFTVDCCNDFDSAMKDNTLDPTHLERQSSYTSNTTRQEQNLLNNDYFTVIVISKTKMHKEFR